jgi:hypothetical protein
MFRVDHVPQLTPLPGTLSVECRQSYESMRDAFLYYHRRLNDPPRYQVAVFSSNQRPTTRTLFVLLPLLTADIELSIVIYQSVETNNGASVGIQAASVATNSAGC